MNSVHFTILRDNPDANEEQHPHTIVAVLQLEEKSEQKHFFLVLVLFLELTCLKKRTHTRFLHLVLAYITKLVSQRPPQVLAYSKKLGTIDKSADSDSRTLAKTSRCE
jgi:hypothetical protein